MFFKNHSQHSESTQNHHTNPDYNLFKKSENNHDSYNRKFFSPPNLLLKSNKMHHKTSESSPNKKTIPSFNIKKPTLPSCPNYITNFKIKNQLKLKATPELKISKIKKGCGCSKTKCLRLFCSCFRNKILCGEHCNCIDCFNNNEHSKIIAKIRKETKKINFFAFKDSKIKIKNNGEIQEFSRGCSCKNYQCLKNYCGCRKNNLKCNPLCKCSDCENDKIVLTSEVAGKLYMKSRVKLRKKNGKINLSNFMD
jgi:hypothetical protein